MSKDLVAEAREALGRINIHAFPHDLAYQYRGGVLGRNVTEILRDVADALETTIVRAERLEAQERYDVTKYRDWKRNHNPLTVSKVRKWAVEAQKEVYAGNGWITHEDYRRAVVPGNLIPVLEQVEGVVVERDDAVVAIERVREILNRDDFGDDWEHDEWVYRQAAERQLSDIEDVLDGAPEPEEEWGCRGETLIGVHTRKSRESAEGAVKDLTEYWAAQDKKFEVVRRRKAGPWMPVSGGEGGEE